MLSVSIFRLRLLFRFPESKRSDPVTEDAAVKDADSPADEPKPLIDWTDPNVPMGNSPPLPRWPLMLQSALWLASIAFLAMIAI